MNRVRSSPDTTLHREEPHCEPSCGVRRLGEEIDVERFDESDSAELVPAIVVFNDDPFTTDDVRLVLKRLREALRADSLPMPM